MLCAIALLFASFFASFPVRFWLAVRRFGESRFKAAIWSDGHMFSLDVVSVFLAVQVLYWAAQDWFGLALPGLRASTSWQPGIFAVLSALACLTTIYINGRQRFDDATRAGMPEAALRWLATRQIITAAEVSAALTRMPDIRKGM